MQIFRSETLSLIDHSEADGCGLCRGPSLTLEQLQAEGVVEHTEKSVWSPFRIKMHFKGLFQTRQLAWSMSVVLANVSQAP